MEVNYKYKGPSGVNSDADGARVELRGDLLREEQVSFKGKVKNPLLFRDAMLMLREIVISDTSVQKKDRTAYFQWLESEIERQIIVHDQYAPEKRGELVNKINVLVRNIEKKDEEIQQKKNEQGQLNKEIERLGTWKDYYRLERKFWSFIKSRDLDLWYVLDPVITVHPDKVTFEAFSLDESIYGILSMDMAAFDLLQKPALGTTNIDFSAKLALELERFRSSEDVVLSVNPEGFTVESGPSPAYIEKKIDLPESWVKGFNQVSAAAFLNGISLTLSKADVYDICSFLRRHKEEVGPRYMEWHLEKNKPIKIVFMPFEKELTLSAIYQGDKNRKEKVWGRRRWLVLEKLIPMAESFTVKLLGFGLPQFVTANMGLIKMTVGFTSWSANDWVKGTSFNLLNGFIGDGNYDRVYGLLKEKRFLSPEEIISAFEKDPKAKSISGIGGLIKRGEGYFDAVDQVIRFRKLYQLPIPKRLYETTEEEYKVKEYLDMGMADFIMKMNASKDFEFTNIYKKGEGQNPIKTKIVIDEDGQIIKLKCNCKEFNQGVRNISQPCAHIVALYMVCTKFLKLNLEIGKEYTTNDIMELLL